ncbi:MAG: Xaa-Pro peptidase family protein [Firmicutes bacterium]|nr:Xaa-Pro peptidase family protein [Bacillota bacterium]
MTLRIQKQQSVMQEQGWQAFLVSAPENVRYLSGYTGDEAWLFLPVQGQASLITDFRYREQAEAECPACRVLMHSRPQPTFYQVLAELTAGCGNLALEGDVVTFNEYQKLAQALPQTQLIATQGVTERLRLVKDAAERETIAQACQKTLQVWEQTRQWLRPGVTEAQAARYIDERIRDMDCQPAFPTIVAAGVNGSLPHHQPDGGKVLASGEMVTMDFGCRWQGYCSDITRTVALGRPSRQMAAIYQIVLEAQLAGVAALGPGVSGKEADAVARDYIQAAGYGPQFGHGAGHGFGLQIHESPTLSPAGTEALPPHCFVTMEPGIYVPGLGGVRIEDSLEITENGARNLFGDDKSLFCL